MDANQCWDVDEAISYMKQLAKFKPIWIEEPTSPDDVLGKLAKHNSPGSLSRHLYRAKIKV